jgi:ribosomal protein L6P/L9E
MEINVTPNGKRTHRAAWNDRALINNMVVGVSTGFQRILEVNGVGYRAELQGKNLALFVGYSHPVIVEPPEGISFEVDTRTRQIKILGYDKQLLGQVAADIRAVRPPEPYKAKVSNIWKKRSAARPVKQVGVSQWVQQNHALKLVFTGTSASGRICPGRLDGQD